MKRLSGIAFLACGLWAQDTLWADAQVRGDFVEVFFSWRSAVTEVPLGANLVVETTPASALYWDSLTVRQRSRFDATGSQLYLPLYLTQRTEANDARRVSLNLLANTPPAGLSFSGQREAVGSWRVPIARFGDTLRLRWAMETGEIVLAPFLRAKARFVQMPIAPVHLCPSVAPAALSAQGNVLTVELPGEFRPQNLTITWYREGVVVGQGLAHVPLLPGYYWAEVAHVCGSSARTDSLLWVSTAFSARIQGEWRVYPQPSAGEVWIEAPYSGPVHVSLCDVAGREVYSTTYEAQAKQPHLLHLPPALNTGLYQLTLRSASQTFTTPFSYAK